MYGPCPLTAENQPAEDSLSGSANSKNSDSDLMDLLNLEEWTDRDQPVSPQPKNLLKEYRETYTQMRSSIRTFEEQDRNPLSDPELAYYLAADSRRLPDDAPDSIDHGTATAAAVEGPSQAADAEQDGQPPADPNAQQDAVTNPGGVQWSCHRPDEAAQDVLPPHQHLRTVRRSHRYGRDGIKRSPRGANSDLIRS